MAELVARLRLIADIRNFSQNLQRAAQQGRTAMRGLNNQVGNVGRSLGGANKASKSFFQTLRANVGTQIKAGIMFATLYQALITFRQTIGAAISELLTLDTALRKVQSITKDSDEAIEALGNQLLKAARRGKLFGQTAGEVATGMFEIVQAGFSVAEAYDIALVSAMAATAGFTDAATAGKAITAVLLAYGLAASDATWAANILFQTVDTGVITFEEIARGMGAALAPAVALRIPLDEITASVALMTRKGIPAARAWTAVTRMLFGFLDPSDQAKQHAADLGFELNAATIETHGFFGAMLLLNEATDEDSELLADIFDRQRALIGAFTLLTDGGEAWTEVQLEMNTAQEGQGALMEAWIERQKALSIRLEIFRAQVLALVVMGLKPLAEGLGTVVDWLSRMIADEMGVFKWLKDTATEVTGLSDAWNGFTQAIKDMLIEGQGGRLSLMFHGMFVVLREGIPTLFEMLALLLRVGTWAVRNKPALIALALAFGAMFIAAHPLLATFQALLLIVGYMEKNWDDWRVRVGGTTAVVLLAVVALNLLWSAFTASRLAMTLFNTNLVGVTASTNLLKRALMNMAAGVVQALKPMIGAFTSMATEAGRAASAAGRVATNLARIVAMPVNIARTVTVTTVQAGQKAVEGAAGALGKMGVEGVQKGIVGGLVKGLPQGIGFGVGAAIIQGIIVAFAIAAAALGISVAVLAAVVVGVLIVAIIAGFMIYKYRKEIWAGLKTLGRVLKEFFTTQLPAMMYVMIEELEKFFTQTLPAWAKSQFTAENMGRWFGRILMASILLAFWPATIIYLFSDKLNAFVDGIAGFLTELPSLIASKIGDAAGAIMGWLVDVDKWGIRFKQNVIKFELKIVEFVTGLPGRIAAFIGDNWKDVLDWLVDAAKWYVYFQLKVWEFYGKIMAFVAGIPAKIASFIGDNWKAIIGFLVDPEKWWTEFKSLVEMFVDIVQDRVGPLLSGIGTAIGGGIRSAIAAALSGIGAFFENTLRGGLGWLTKIGGPIGSVLTFFGAMPSGMQDVLDWLEGKSSGSPSATPLASAGGLRSFASGIRNFMGGLAVVGERGAELVNLPRGADVIRNADMGQAIRGGDNGGLHVSAEVNIQMEQDYEKLKRRVLQEVEEQLDNAAATAGLAKPRFGTFGSGIPRT